MFRQYYDRKLIISGSIAELYDYESPVLRIANKVRVGRAGQFDTTAETKALNRCKNASRARRKVFRYVNANFSCASKFVTFTFAENMTDLKQANRELTKAIKRINRYLKQSLQYIVVVEFQERGAVHYHVLMNAPYIPNEVLSHLWGQGFVKINAIDSVDNIGAYITKYMTKENLDERLAGQKSYFMSRNLRRPEETTDEELIDEVLANVEVQRVAYTAEFDSEYNGKIRYVQLVLPAPVSLAEYRKQSESICFPPLWGECQPLGNI